MLTLARALLQRSRGAAARFATVPPGPSAAAVLGAVNALPLPEKLRARAEERAATASGEAARGGGSEQYMEAFNNRLQLSPYQARMTPHP